MRGYGVFALSTNADDSEKKEIYHQDLKSANVLLTEVDGIIRAKIGDFGLSRMLLSPNPLQLVMKQAEQGASDDVRLNGGTSKMLSGTCKFAL
jgi:serine/threonine protein kinase